MVTRRPSMGKRVPENNSLDESPVKKKKTGESTIERESKHKVEKTDPSAKVDWKEFKDSKKKLKIQRKKSDCSLYDVHKNAKDIWELARCSSCPAEERDKHVTSLHGLLKGNYSQIVYSHDMARVAQWALKSANHDIQQEVFQELESHILEMSQKKYAVKCVICILENGSESMVNAVVNSLLGHSVKLLCHNIASAVVQLAYEKHATLVQKNAMKKDFYGVPVKDTGYFNVKCMQDAINVCLTLKAGIIASTKSNVLKVLNKGQASCALLHSVARDLFCHLQDLNEKEQLITSMRPFFNKFATSKDGAWLCMNILWMSPVKERKNIMKTEKEFIKDIAFHAYGCLAIMAMVDCIDDTVLLSKIILSQITSNVGTFAEQEHARKVILYLTAHRDSQFLHPSVIEMLKEGDHNTHSKKPMETRREEILEFISQPFLEFAASGFELWVKSYSLAMVALAILKFCHGHALENAYSSLADALIKHGNEVYNDSDGIQLKKVESLSLHKMLKNLILNDRERHKKDSEGVLFSKILVDKIDTGASQWLRSNRGAFLFIFLLETEIKSVTKVVKRFLTSNRDVLENSKAPAAAILLGKLTKNSSPKQK